MFPLLLAAAVAAQMGCRLGDPAVLPAGALRFDPLPPYGYWWDMVRECSQRDGSLADVTWYYVPGADSIYAGSEWVSGYWTPTGDRIVLAGSALKDGAIVRHEMLHAITRGGHDRSYFVDRCGGVVVCEGRCAAETGGPIVPAADAPNAALADLRVATRVYPDSPTVSRDGGWVSVEVAVTNDAPTDVWVPLDSFPFTPFAAPTFGYDLSFGCLPPSQSAYAYVWDDLRFGLGAHETRRYVFDTQLYAGNWCVRGYFNSDTASTQQTVIGQ